MKRKHHTPQEIIAKLREAEVELNQGSTIEAVSRKLEISEQTFHRWRHLYGGMKGPEMARLKKLVSPAGKRRAVHYLCDERSYSERNACRLVKQPRSTQRYQARIDEQDRC